MSLSCYIISCKDLLTQKLRRYFRSLFFPFFLNLIIAFLNNFPIYIRSLIEEKIDFLKKKRTIIFDIYSNCLATVLSIRLLYLKRSYRCCEPCDAKQDVYVDN